MIRSTRVQKACPIVSWSPLCCPDYGTRLIRLNRCHVQCICPDNCQDQDLQVVCNIIPKGAMPRGALRLTANNEHRRPHYRHPVQYIVDSVMFTSLARRYFQDLSDWLRLYPRNGACASGRKKTRSQTRGIIPNEKDLRPRLSATDIVSCQEEVAST